MTTKVGVDISKIHPTIGTVLKIADELWPIVFPEDADGMVVTSGHEDVGARVHAAKSKHYLANSSSGMGEAVDIRANDILQYQVHKFLTLLWMLLEIRMPQQQFKMYHEGALGANSHIHIQLM